MEGAGVGVTVGAGLEGAAIGAAAAGEWETYLPTSLLAHLHHELQYDRGISHRRNCSVANYKL
jgi:hypothetical protein